MTTADGSPDRRAMRDAAAPSAATASSRVRWARVSDAAATALELPADARAAHLDAVCREDRQLRQEVERLMRACDQAAGAADFLAEPAPVFAQAVVADVVRAEAERAASLRAEIPAMLGPILADRYTIEREIGRGGMATVYLARDERHGRAVAIKVVHPDLALTRGAERFLREIEIAAGLQHPHIVPLFDSGAATRLLYYVMPYVEGESLRRWLAPPRTVPVRDVVQLLRELADALAYAHDQGIVHRDLKPENILYSRGHALIVDFGVAKALAVTGTETHLTAAGEVLGTPGYMAPEQAAGAPIDHRSDLYALGLVAYEMLVGARPIHARRPDWAHEIGRHRPDVPRPLATLVAQLLAARPADRPPSARDVVQALDALAPAGAFGWPALVARRSVRALAGAGIAVAVAIGAWRAIAPPPPIALDANRVVIFPLDQGNALLPPGTGEDVATLIGHAVEGTAPLTWVPATDHLSASQRNDMRTVLGAERRAISEGVGAAFYIDGSVVREGDSVVVGLRLHSVRGDSIVDRRHKSGRLDAPSDAGLRALAELLVPLLDPGRRVVDVSALSTRPPAAVAAFLQGERAYRASQFAHALDRYHAALAADSLFAIAALKGAQAASWLEESDEAGRLVQLALRNAAALPPHGVVFARGLQYYLDGAADSAVASFTRGIAFDALRAEPWMALGDVYRHLLPQAVGLDSLAERAFVRARALDPEFTPPLYHLAELALRRGAVARADTLVRAFTQVNPDTTARRTLDLMLACVRTGLLPAQWRQMADATPVSVLEAGTLLAGGAANSGCARDAFWALLNTPQASEDVRWSALFGLQGLLVATGRDAEVVDLFSLPVATALDADALLLLVDRSAGAAIQARASAVAEQLGTDYRRLSASRLWLLARWDADRGRADTVRIIARELARRADSSHAPLDSLRSRSIAVRVALANGDTAMAVHALRALTPQGPRADLLWSTWKGLGSERLLLARLLLAQHHAPAARQIAGQLDASKPIGYLLYLRAGLQVLADAAELEGDRRSATSYRARLAALDRDTAAVPWSFAASTSHHPQHDEHTK